MGIRDLIGRLGEEERRFREREFLAPVLPGGRVLVRLGGIACEMRVRGGAGWCVCRPLDARRAEAVRPADPLRVREFLSGLPYLRAVLAAPEGLAWAALPANPSNRLKARGLFPVLLAEGVRAFDAAIVRFDGGGFLFDRLDRRRDPGAADYLRAALRDLRPAASLRRPGLTAAERDVYAWLLSRRLEALKPEIQRRLESSLGHAGASLSGWVERGAEATVTYSVDGRPITSVVRKDSLEVLSAGVCLSGEDRKFDLASLVGVLREGFRRGGLEDD